MVDQLSKDRKHNLKIYSIYRSLSLDLIFYYVIEFLFLTQEKGISEYNVILSYSFYAIFKILVQIPVNQIIGFIGNKKSIIIGNSLNLLFIILVMMCSNEYMLIFIHFILALGFSFKDVADLSLLKASIPEAKEQSTIYAKLEERGFKNYFLINAITSTLSGSLYMLNPYLPLVGSTIFLILSLFIAFAFKDIKRVKINKEELKSKQYLENMKKQTKFILKSPRLRCLFIYIGLVSGMINLLTTYRISLLVEVNVEDQYITMIVAAIGIACARGSEKQSIFSNKLKNKSFAIIIFTMMSQVILLGLCGKFFNGYPLSIAMIILMLIIIGFMQGVHDVICNKYLSNFTDEKLLPHIISAKEVIRYIFTAIISLIGAVLIKYVNTSNAMIIIGSGALFLGIGLIIYMESRIGLSPEEYTNKDIYDEKYIH